MFRYSQYVINYLFQSGLGSRVIVFRLQWCLFTMCEGKPTRMRRLCLKTSEAACQGGLGITSSSEEVYKLMLWPYPFWDFNAHGLKVNLEI